MAPASCRCSSSTTASSRTSCSRPSPMLPDRGLAASRCNDAEPVHHRSLRILRRRARARQRFSELNDPEEQAARFRAQVAQGGGDEEAMYFDADYIRALEVGLPPTGGLGVGVGPAGDALRRCAVDPRRAALPAAETRRLSRRLTRPVGERQRRERAPRVAASGWPRPRTDDARSSVAAPAAAAVRPRRPWRRRARAPRRRDADRLLAAVAEHAPLDAPSAGCARRFPGRVAALREADALEQVEVQHLRRPQLGGAATTSGSPAATAARSKSSAPVLGRARGAARAPRPAR